MKLCSVLGLVILTLSIIHTSLALVCFSCTGKDPHCSDAKRSGCGWFCYKIILRSLGTDLGCTASEDYCKSMKDRLGPIVQMCTTCETDDCNSAKGMNFFYPLLLFGVIINIVLVI